jgi:hypothetical protein
MSNEQEVTEVPVLEVEFAKFLQICEKINIVDSCKFFSMPDHSKKYSERATMPVSELMTMLLDFETEENSWRVNQKTVVDLATQGDKIIIGDKTLFDSNRIIIISRLNSAYIVPGERSIKEGGFMPNEIVKLSNFFSSQLFLLRFSDVPDEKSGGFDLKVEYSLIDRTRIQSNHATQN